MSEPRKTPLHDLHVALGGRFVDFAGWALPVQYPTGIVAEHQHTRTAAGLFDVSHMGQVRISGPDHVARFEALVPGDIAGLDDGRMRYTQFTTDAGTIIDDLMVLKRPDDLAVVVNAGRRAVDLPHMQAGLAGCKVELRDDLALLALQGPLAVNVLERLGPVTDMEFMTGATVDLAGLSCLVTRSGYTGEDGFEISLPASAATDFARRLLAEPEVKPIGLGARDSLRLEAGLCLYGHDIDETTSPIEAGLAWSIAPRRRSGGGFPGAAVVQKQLAEKPTRRLVGIKPEGRAPAREGTPILLPGGEQIGVITSGGFGPTVNGPVAMGYVAIAHAKAGTPVHLMVRGKPLPATVSTIPFIPKRYAKKGIA